MNYLWELWEISERSPPDRRSDHRDPFPVHGQQPARPASLRPYPQQQPRAAAAPGSSPEAPGQPPGSSRAAAPTGALLGVMPYVTNRDILKTIRVPVKGSIFYPFSDPPSPYPPTRRSAAFSRNFLFLFFLFWDTESYP